MKFVRTPQKIGLFALGEKAFFVLKGLIDSGVVVESIIIGRDNNVINDYYSDIFLMAQSHKITIYNRKEFLLDDNTLYIAAGWRWIIPNVKKNQLIVFHDSLLPKYRGFAPLVNGLIKGERTFGVSVLWAEKEYDTGTIILQKSIEIDYPMKIGDLIHEIAELYYTATLELAVYVISNAIPFGCSQNEQEATISIWRDEEDYRILWNSSAAQIKRFIDAVGYPYAGSFSDIDNERFTIDNVEIVSDVRFELNHHGKVFNMTDVCIDVLCGEGALRIFSLKHRDTHENALPLKKFRIRFT
jgi:methionyl-tRNA formyltransferase